MGESRSPNLSPGWTLGYFAAGLFGIGVAAFFPGRYSDWLMIVALSGIGIILARFIQSASTAASTAPLRYLLGLVGLVLVVRVVWVLFSILSADLLSTTGRLFRGPPGRVFRIADAGVCFWFA
jgi:hypothetical protein